jgi:hypothetical protein
MQAFVQSIMVSLMLLVSSCQMFGRGPVVGNEGGSIPISDQEAVDMQKAVNRCHRSGGTRVVKIRGELRCY